MSTAPVIRNPTMRDVGAASARRPAPLRARICRPREMVPSGKTPMQAPASSSSMARPSAAASPRPRSMGIWPMWFSTHATTGLPHSEALASARICRLGAATPATSGSQWLSWLPKTTAAPGWSSTSAPVTSRRPHHLTNGVATIMTMR